MNEEKNTRPKYVEGGSNRRDAIRAIDEQEEEEEKEKRSRLNDEELRELKEYIQLSGTERDAKRREEALAKGKKIPFSDIASSDIDAWRWFTDSQWEKVLEDYKIRREKFGEEKMAKWKRDFLKDKKP